MMTATERLHTCRDNLSAYATGYVPVLDGLRAVSISVVAMDHLTGLHVLPAGLAMALFFFVSGMLITGQLLAELESEGTVNLARFYMRRALRLFPAAFSFIVICGSVGALAGINTSASGWLSAFLYGANYYDIFIGYQSNLPHVPHPFKILWSLAVEEHFYLVWPMALLLLCRRKLTPAVIVLAAIAMIIVPIWRERVFYYCLHFSSSCGQLLSFRIGKATDTRIDAIAWGALAAVLTVHPSAGWYRRLLQSSGTLWASLGLLIFAGTSFARMPLIAYSRYFTSGVALFFLVPSLVGQQSLLRRVLELGPMVWIGRLSYSIYLWHWGAISLSGLIPAPAMIRLLARMGLAVALPLGSYYLLERPILHLRRRFGSKAAIAPIDTQHELPRTAGSVASS